MTPQYDKLQLPTAQIPTHILLIMHKQCAAYKTVQAVHQIQSAILQTTNTQYSFSVHH